MIEKELQNITSQLISLASENEWLEFKQNNYSPEEIGKRISALSNGACLTGHRFGYLIFGIKDGNHNIVGTKFKPKTEKVGGEELGSGIDKVIIEIEKFQLPAPVFLEMERHTKVTLFSHIEFKDMSKKDRIRSCYQHCCLKYVSNENMTNKTLRERFNIDPRNSSMVSRIIEQTINQGLIKSDDDENTSKKYAKYIPIWS